MNHLVLSSILATFLVTTQGAARNASSVPAPSPSQRLLLSVEAAAAAINSSNGTLTEALTNAGPAGAQVFAQALGSAYEFAGRPEINSRFALYVSQIISVASASGAVTGNQGVASAAVGPSLAITDAVNLGGSSEDATALAIGQNFGGGHSASALALTISAVINNQGCSFIRPTLLKAQSLASGPDALPFQATAFSSLANNFPSIQQCLDGGVGNVQASAAPESTGPTG